MKLALGAPIAERAWILPLWWECLQKQTLQPDYYRFVYSPSQDGTLEFLEGLGETHDVETYRTSLAYFSRNDRNADKKDPWRAEHFSKLRNRLKTLFMQTDADVFVSLDTDILLEEPTVLEQLVGDLDRGWDLMAPRTSLHPIEDSAYNAGWFADANHGAYTQAWRRAELNDVTAYRPPLKIEIPMAAFVIKRFALGLCAYRPHECGEDVGFAQSFREHKLRAGWRTDLAVKHVWGPQWLEQMA